MDLQEKPWGFSKLRAFIIDNLKVRNRNEYEDYTSSQLVKLMDKNRDLWYYVEPTAGTRQRAITKENAIILLDRIKQNRRAKQNIIVALRRNDANNVLDWKGQYLVQQQFHTPMRTQDLLAFIRAYIYPEYSDAQLHSTYKYNELYRQFHIFANPRTGAMRKLYQGLVLDTLLCRIKSARERHDFFPEHFKYTIMQKDDTNRIAVFRGAVTNGDVVNAKTERRTIWVEPDGHAYLGHVFFTEKEGRFFVTRTEVIKKHAIHKKQIECLNWIVRMPRSFVMAWLYVYGIFTPPTDLNDVQYRAYAPWVLNRINEKPLVLSDRDLVEPNEIYDLFSYEKHPSFAPDENTYDHGHKTNTKESRILRVAEGEAAKARLLAEQKRNAELQVNDFAALEQADLNQEMSEERRKEIDEERRKEIDDIFFADLDEKENE